VVAFDPQADHHAKNRKSMHCYVYILRSTRADRLYVGSSAEPDERLKSHNFGRVCSTKAWRPWERVLLADVIRPTVENVVAFDPQADHHAKEYQDRATAEKRTLVEVRMGPYGTGSTFGEVAERLPLVAFGPRGRGSSREMRRSCHVILLERKIGRV
jgi:GIY-YIG catalytic domain